MINVKTLAHFIGSEELHVYGPRLKYTDGVKYVCEKGEAFWLLDLINSYELHVKPVIAEEFQVWKLTVDLEKNEGVMTCDDGNDNIIITQRIPFTDFPLKEIKFYYEYGVLMLPTER